MIGACRDMVRYRGVRPGEAVAVGPVEVRQVPASRVGAVKVGPVQTGPVEEWHGSSGLARWGEPGLGWSCLGQAVGVRLVTSGPGRVRSGSRGKAGFVPSTHGESRQSRSGRSGLVGSCHVGSGWGVARQSGHGIQGWSRHRSSGRGKSWQSWCVPVRLGVSRRRRDRCGLAVGGFA